MTPSRVGALFGIVTAVLLVGAVLASGDTPDGDASDQEWIDYVEGDQSAIVVRAYLLVVASLSLVGFYSFGVRPRLGSSDATDSALSQAGAGVTLLAAGAFGAAGLVGAAVGAADQFGDVAVDPAIARLFDNWLYGFLVVGSALPLGALMGIVAIQSRRRSAFAPWVMWLSIVGVVAMAASIIFIPFVLAPVWLIAVSVTLLRGSEPANT